MKKNQILFNQLAILSALATMSESQAERKALLREYITTENLINKIPIPIRIRIRERIYNWIHSWKL